MRSSSGKHFIALDHVRALAIFMVVCWHFLHGLTGAPVPYGQAPAIFPLALLDEGHTGVALFMTLSGYLFAKLLDGQSIRFPLFIYNRMLRLIPLLVVMLALYGLRHHRGPTLGAYLSDLAWGVLLPTWPSGAWSITVELHFYVILPVLLWMLRTSRWLVGPVILAAVLCRAVLLAVNGDVQDIAYYTLAGRIDQFVLGIAAFHFRSWFAGRHLLAVAVFIAFAAFYWFFDASGGISRHHAATTAAALWVVMPTIEGLAYAAGIAWYDTSFQQRPSWLSSFIGRIGAYSYSIYLLHSFVVMEVANFINRNVMHIADFYRALAWAGLFLIGMVPIAYLSYHLVEAPFLRLRKSYVRRTQRNTARAIMEREPTSS